MAKTNKTSPQPNDTPLSELGLESLQELLPWVSRIKWTWLAQMAGRKTGAMKLSENTFVYTDKSGRTWSAVAPKPEDMAMSETDGVVSVTFPEFILRSERSGLRLSVKATVLRFRPVRKE